MADMVQTAKKVIKKKVISKKQLLDAASVENSIYIMDSKGVILCQTDKDDNVYTVGGLPYSAFFEEFKSKIPFETPGIMDKNVIKYKIGTKGPSTYHYLFYEFNPRSVGISHRGRDNDPSIMYNISLPYVVFFTVIKESNGILLPMDNHTKVFAGNKPITSITQPLCRLPLGNIDYDGRICWGTGNGIQAKTSENATIFGNRIANSFFASPFNEHLIKRDNYPQGLTSIKDWNDQTKLNPNFGQTLNYVATTYTIENILRDVSSILEK